MNKMMENLVFVIGNGFDLNCGLKTSYLNFYNSEIYSNNKHLFSKIDNQLMMRIEAKLWIDIELILRVMGKHFKNVELKEEYLNLCNCLTNYLTSAQTKLIDENSLAVYILKEFESPELTIIDFNYTNTMNSILKESSLKDKYSEIKVEHYKIHGNLIDKNIIFGIDDSDTIDNSNVYLRKSTKHNFGTKNCNLILNQANKIVFFGYSLGSTDHMYFKDFFQVFKGKNLYFIFTMTFPMMTFIINCIF